jgi:hypothetical protein
MYINDFAYLFYRLRPLGSTYRTGVGGRISKKGQNPPLCNFIPLFFERSKIFVKLIRVKKKEQYSNRSEQNMKK